MCHEPSLRQCPPVSGANTPEDSPPSFYCHCFAQRRGHNEASGGLFPAGKAFSSAIVFAGVGERSGDLQPYCLFMLCLHVSVSFSPSLDDKCLQINWIIVFKPSAAGPGGCLCVLPPSSGRSRGSK